MAHQLKTKKDAAVVIGGVNMDIWGRPDGALVMRDSTPGTVRMTPGGVGRNIAHDLRLLGMDVAFISAMGDDLIGQALMQSCTELGFDMQHALVKKGGHSSTYLFVTEAGGDMCAAINDMDICSQLTPAFFEPLLPKLRDFGAMVLDANLPAETLEYLADRLRVPLVADAVSTAKAPRLMGALGRLAAVKPNAIEAETLTGIPVHGPDSAARAAARSRSPGTARGDRVWLVPMRTMSNTR